MPERKFDYEYDISEHAVVVPYEIVAAACGVHPHTSGFKAIDYLEEFSAKVAPLEIREFNRLEGRARAVTPRWPIKVNEALERELFAGTQTRVMFVSGKPVSRRNMQALQEEVKDRQYQFAMRASENHPARELLSHLNSQNNRPLKTLIDRNMSIILAEIRMLPKRDAAEAAKRRQYMNLARFIQDHPYVYYAGVARTPRLFSVGPSLNQLQKGLRKKLLIGSIELDLHAAQLAVVAQLWSIKPMLDILEKGIDVWEYLAGIVKQPLNVYKPLLKQAVYAMIFGMHERNVKRLLILKCPDGEEVGREVANRLLRHPILEQLLIERNLHMERIFHDGGGQDAFGEWHVAEQTDKGVRSAMAGIVQSYEMKLMLPTLPVLKNEKQIYVMSWLHDGMTVHFGDKTKQDRQEKRLQVAVQRQANELNIPTYLQVSRLH